MAPLLGQAVGGVKVQFTKSLASSRLNRRLPMNHSECKASETRNHTQQIRFESPHASREASISR